MFDGLSQTIEGAAKMLDLFKGFHP
jgi:hypothetical protein